MHARSLGALLTSVAVACHGGPRPLRLGTTYTVQQSGALALQARVPLLSFTAGAFAGAGVALGLGVNTGYEAVRAGVALAMGAVVGFAAERLAGMIGARRV